MTADNGSESLTRIKPRGIHDTKVLVIRADEN